MENLQNECEDDFEKLTKKLQNCNFELLQKVGLKELTKMQVELQRFAEYKDLKHLHALVVPEISKFEIKLIEYQKKLEGLDHIIMNFDEIIQTKSSKITLEEFQNNV